jgi:hypothetical protein
MGEIIQCESCGAALFELEAPVIDRNWWDELQAEAERERERKERGWRWEYDPLGPFQCEILNREIWADGRGWKRHLAYKARRQFAMRKRRRINWRKNRVRARRRGEVKCWRELWDIPF